MRIGIFAKTFAGARPATVLAAAAAAGYDGVQYNMACSGAAAMPDAITRGQADAVCCAATDTGLAIFAVSGTYNMIHPNPAVRADGLRRLGVLAKSANAMTTRLITLCTGTRDPDDQWAHHPGNTTAEAWRDLLGAFEIAVGIAETHDILLGVEPELANIVNSASAARRLMDQMQSDRIRIVLDPANLFERATAADQRAQIDRAIGLLEGHIVMAHAKDRDASGAVVRAGQGVIDFDHFLGALRRAGFAGPVVTHGLHADEAAGVADFLQARLQGLLL